MTDVLIKNWCIPECCMDCDPDFAYAINCKAYNENNDFTRQRAENCPLVEIKHSQDGDTISRAVAIDAVLSVPMPLRLADEIDEVLRLLPSAEAEPPVIRSRTFMPTKDFKEWAKRIRETNPNAVVIPCDAEVVSAESVQGWIPVSERLPEEREWIGTKSFGTTISDTILMTFDVDGTRFVKPLSLQNGKLSRPDAQTMDAIYQGWKMLAWMPLPKPYKGGEDE